MNSCYVYIPQHQHQAKDENGSKMNTWPLNAMADGKTKSSCAKKQSRCWILNKIVTFLGYVVRKCLCGVKSSSTIHPHALSAGLKNQGAICFSNITSTGTTTRTHIKEGTPIFNVDVDDVSQDGDNDGVDQIVDYICPQRLIQVRRPGTPRKIFPLCYPKNRDFIVELESNGDSADTNSRLEGSNYDMTLDFNSCGEDTPTILQQRSQPKPVSFTIGPNPVPRNFFLNSNLIFKVLTIEFDLRCGELGGPTSESVFNILQMAFLHPNVQEFRVRIDNWRNYIHQKEIILPVSIIGPQFRSDYPMRLQTLIVYSPGITLHHLLIWQGFILSQVKLETFICNFDAVEWIFYKPILQKLKSNLRKLELYSITNHNGNIDDILPFDWKVLGDCQNLECVKLWGDMRYYGLCHTNLETLRMEKLTEIELRFVDLGIKDMEYLLLQGVNLQLINLLYFTPIPSSIGPEISLPADEFITIVALALSDQHIHRLSFTDYKLPGSILDRQNQLEGYCQKIGYSSNWSDADKDGVIRNIDIMEFFKPNSYFRKSSIT